MDSDISEADKADGKAGGEGGDGGSKKSRPRTNIKEDQLKILHAAFVATPLPSKEEREELVMKTGLPMRVIQVRPVHRPEDTLALCVCYASSTADDARCLEILIDPT